MCLKTVGGDPLRSWRVRKIARSDEGPIMNDDLRRHLTGMLAKLRPLVDMAERDGVPGQAAARLRAAAFELDDALDPGATARHRAEDSERSQENMEIIRQREREGGAWGIDEA
jgi:hypothetical protein